MVDNPSCGCLLTCCNALGIAEDTMLALILVLSEWAGVVGATALCVYPGDASLWLGKDMTNASWCVAD